MVRGQYGWAAIGDGVMVYARTRAEALRRFRAAFAHAGEAPAPRSNAEHTENVRLHVADTAAHEPDA